MGSLTQPKLPIIDLSKQNMKPGTNSWLSKRNDVVRALEEYGCFVAMCNNFSLELDDAIFRASKDLFNLPLETKARGTSYSHVHHIYLGKEEPIVPPFEAIGIPNAIALDAAQKFTNLMWPSGNEFFCETANSYAKLVSELDQTVMRMVADRYGVEKHYESIFRATTYFLRFIKHKGVDQKNESKSSMIPHTDKSFMTILHQHQVKGLEIQTKDGEWIPIEPSPSSFIVMVGDALMAWTNGRIEPPVHRVIMSGNEERYSLGLFAFIKDLIIQVPEELVDETHPLQYKPFEHFKFTDFYFTDEGQRSKCVIKAYCGV